MIRFSAGLVVVAIGVLIGGVATSKLLLVYIAIGLSVAALIALAIGVVLKREEIFGEQQRTMAPAATGTGTEQPVLVGQNSIEQNGTVDPHPARVPAAAAAAAGEAAQSPFGQPAYGQAAYGQAAGGYGRDVFGPPVRETPPGRESASPWDTPSAVGHRWAYRQDSPWTLEPPAASAPAASAPAASAPAASAPAAPPAPTSPAPTSPVAPPPVPPRREKPSPPHGESFSAPAAADYLRSAPPGVTSSRAEPASPAPASSVPDWPSWFERPARSPHDTTPDKPAPAESATADDRAGTDAGAPASGAAPTRAEPILTSAGTSDETGDTASATDLLPATSTSDDDDDWWPRRSWLLDGDAEDTGDADAAPEDSGSARTAEPVAETAATPAIPADAAEPPAEDEPEGAPADLAESDSDRDKADDTSDATAGASEPPAGKQDSSKQVTVVPGVPRYHEANCILIRFMADDDMQKMTVHEAAEAGCTPCRACQPDEPTT